MYKSKVMCSVTLLDVHSYLTAGNNLQCPIWHIRRNNLSVCGDGLDNVVSCKGSHIISLLDGSCMTWDDKGSGQSLSIPTLTVCHGTKCPQDGCSGTIQIPTNITGIKLTSTSCKRYNRQGVHCRQCRDGYGPAVFSDSFSCAGCSKYTHLWILNLFLQLIMLSLMYMVVIATFSNR